MIQRAQNTFYVLKGWADTSTQFVLINTCLTFTLLLLDRWMEEDLSGKSDHEPRHLSR